MTSKQNVTPIRDYESNYCRGAIPFLNFCSSTNRLSMSTAIMKCRRSVASHFVGKVRMYYALSTSLLECPAANRESMIKISINNTVGNIIYYISKYTTMKFLNIYGISHRQKYNAYLRQNNKYSIFVK